MLFFPIVAEWLYAANVRSRSCETLFLEIHSKIAQWNWSARRLCFIFQMSGLSLIAQNVFPRYLNISRLVWLFNMTTGREKEIFSQYTFSSTRSMASSTDASQAIINYRFSVTAIVVECPYGIPYNVRAMNLNRQEMSLCRDMLGERLDSSPGCS